MLFKPLQYDSGKTKDIAITYGSTVAKGDPLSFTSGYAALAGTGEITAVRFVAMQGDTITATGDTVLAVKTFGIEFEATTAANTAQSQVGAECNLNATGEVDNNFATGDIFVITETVGAAADKLVRGYFLDRVN